MAWLGTRTFGVGRTFSTRTRSTRSSSALRPYHPAVLDWRARVLQVGGTISDAALSYHNTFMFALEDAGIASKIVRLNTFSGDSFASALVPLVRTCGRSADRLTAFSASDWSQATGLKGDGATKFLNTGVKPDMIDTGNATLLFYGSGFEQDSASHRGIGMTEASPGSTFSVAVRRPLTATVPSFRCGNSGSANVELGFTISRSQGILIGATQGTGPTRVFFQGNLENQQIPVATHTLPTVFTAREIYVFGQNLNQALDTATSAYGYAYGIFKELTEDQMWDLSLALNTLMASLGRDTMPKHIACWGDSLTSGAGATSSATSYPFVLAGLEPASTAIYGGGIGGQNTTEILARVLADTRRRDNISVFWGGHQDTDLANIDACVSRFQQMVDHLTTDRFLIMGPINDNTQIIGTDGYNAVVELNGKLAATFPDNYLDIRSYLLTQGNGGAQDNTDVANGVIPTSLRFDGLHLNNTGYNKVANRVHTFFVTKGWL